MCTQPLFYTLVAFLKKSQIKMISPTEITDWRISTSSRPKDVKLKMTGRKLTSGVTGQRGVKAKLRKTNRCKARARLYTDIRCALLLKEWSMVDGPASAGSIDLYGLAMNLRVSYRASHFFVIRCIVALEGRAKILPIIELQT